MQSSRIAELEATNIQLDETISRLNIELEAARAKAIALEQKSASDARERQAMTATVAQQKEHIENEINEKLRISEKVIAERRHTHAKITSLQGI